MYTSISIISLVFANIFQSFVFVDSLTEDHFSTTNQLQIFNLNNLQLENIVDDSLAGIIGRIFYASPLKQEHIDVISRVKLDLYGEIKDIENLTIKDAYSTESVAGLIFNTTDVDQWWVVYASLIRDLLCRKLLTFDNSSTLRCYLGKAFTGKEKKTLYLLY